MKAGCAVAGVTQHFDRKMSEYDVHSHSAPFEARFEVDFATPSPSIGERSLSIVRSRDLLETRVSTSLANSPRPFSPRYNAFDISERRPTIRLQAIGAIAEAPPRFSNSERSPLTTRRRSLSSPTLMRFIVTEPDR
jgi:hypothetical protein